MLPTAEVEDADGLYAGACSSPSGGHRVKWNAGGVYGSVSYKVQGSFPFKKKVEAAV